jgi:protein-tyrosine kinase
MSRIHEALKRAENERAAATTAEAASGADTAFDPVRRDAQGSGRETAAAVASGIFTQTLVAPPPTEHLTLDSLRAHCYQPHWNLLPNVNVFSNPSITAHAAEQFRTLRSRLYQIRGEQQLRSILVTSAVPSEGKSFVTSNLAQALVRQAGRSALIIDADLRRPHLHVPLGAPSSPGLSEYLRGDADETAIIQRGLDEDLYFIPGGSTITNPSELLLNGRMKTLLNRLMPIFNWVIVDSPPCLMVSDARVIADLCDAILLVVRAASTPVASAQRARQELQGKNVLGAVLNSVESGSAYGSYYYDYGKAKE